MNDREAQQLLRGIDAPRPLPEGLRDELESVLSEGLAQLDAPRTLPEDLRARLEVTLVGGTPVPARVRRQLLGVTGAPARLAAAAIVIVVALAGGLVVAVSRDGGPGEVASPAVTSTTASSADSSGSASGGRSSSGQEATGATAGGTTTTTQALAGDAASGAAAPSASASRSQAALRVAAIGSGVVADGFYAWIKAHGGQLGGRPVQLVSSPSSAVATVNLDDRRLSERPPGVVFETAFVEESATGGDVVSLASAPERQATIAVAHALDGAPSDIRAAVYVGANAPWSTTVVDAIERALDARGVSYVRVPFTVSAPAFVPADVAFLSIDAESVRTWVGQASGAPRLGTWGVGSAWDEGIAARGVRVGLRAVSPYAALDENERALLEREVGIGAVNAGVVHGWATAAALDHLLARNGGAALAATDLDSLAGWSSGWAPPYEVRRGTRSRTPDAIELVATRDGFVPRGTFERAG